MKFAIVVVLLLIQSTALFAKESTAGGRFQLIQLNEMRRDQFLLDTQTGDIWRGVCADVKEGGECIGHYWQREDVEGKYVRSKSK